MTQEIMTLAAFTSLHFESTFVQIEGQHFGVNLLTCRRCGLVAGDPQLHMSYAHSVLRLEPLVQRFVPPEVQP